MNPAPRITLSAATNLIKSLFQRGSPLLARRLFDEMPNKDVVAWTAMISGHASTGRHADAWATFREMSRSPVCPNAFTLSSALKACEGLNWRAGGASLHAIAIRCGVDRQPYVENALLHVYASCSDVMKEAREVFDGMTERTPVSWSTIIAGYTHRGEGYNAIHMFRRMMQEGAEMNPFTSSIAIRACASIGSLIFGKQIHTATMKSGWCSNLPVANSLLDMYCRCISPSDAKRFFAEMPQRNLITWNTMIAGLERSLPDEALQLFLEMSSRDIPPNCFTFTSVASTCATLAVLNCGQQVHGAMIRRGFVGNPTAANALLDMYAKSGNLPGSERIFSEMAHKDLLSWTSMVIGYAINGRGKEAMRVFDEMIGAGVRPDHVAFMGVLSACSHAGFVEEGLKYFDTMRTHYNLFPDKEIFGCVVDLLGRAGRVREAYELIETMGLDPDESIWGALLGACKMHDNVDLGKLAARKILDLNPDGAKIYVMLSNVHAASLEWRELAEARRLMRETGSKKEAGRSWIDVRNKMCSFVAGDQSNPHFGLVDGVLQILAQHMDQTSCISDSDALLIDLERDIEPHNSDGA